MLCWKAGDATFSFKADGSRQIYMLDPVNGMALWLRVSGVVEWPRMVLRIPEIGIKSIVLEGR